MPDVTVVPVDGGVMIQLTDKVDYGMFTIGSAKPDARVVQMLERIAGVIARQPGEVIISGHTDARPFKSATYDNWRLSSARAQMAYYMLVRGGLDESACCASKAMPTASRKIRTIRMRRRTAVSTFSSSPPHEAACNALLSGSGRGPFPDGSGGGHGCGADTGPDAGPDANIGGNPHNAGARTLQARALAAHVAGSGRCRKAGSGGDAEQASGFVSADMQRAPAEVWDNPENVYAAIVYLFNGGNPEAVRKVLTGLKSGTVPDGLVKGALAYASGQTIEVVKLFPFRCRQMSLWS